MHNFTSLFLRAVLAFSIALGAPAALAGPIYRVSLDTSAFAGSTGFLDLGLSGGDTSASAFVSNFSGDFLDEVLHEGDASGNATKGVILGNGSGVNLFTQALNLGGLFSFDVSVQSDNTLFGTLFSVALFDQAFAYLGAQGDLFTIDLVPGEADALEVLAPNLVQVAQVAEVPEPGQWLLLASGLLLIGAMRRMQRR